MFLEQATTEGLEKGKQEYMDKGSGFVLMPIFVIVFLASGAQAAAPVSPPESRFVWEPDANLTFTWTPANFDGFYYDSKNKAGNESLTIRLDNIKDRSIPIGGIVYHKAVGQTNTGYREFGKYAVIEFTGEKYLAEYPAGKNNITGEINQIRLHKILIDDNTSNIFMNGSRVMLFYGHDIEIRSVNISGSSVLLSLKMDGDEIDTRTLGVGENYTYETKDGQMIAVQVDSVIAGQEENSVSIKRIFQTSEIFTQYYKKVDIFGLMKVTDVSDTGITMKNMALSVDLKPGSTIKIMDNIIIKEADSNDLRLYLYRDWGWGPEKSEHRGALHTASNHLIVWDGLNYAGFLYDFESGNYSESLEIMNISGRMIPKGGLTYTSYRAKVHYAVLKTEGKKSVKNISYDTFGLGGNKYAVKSNGLSKILIEQRDNFDNKKVLYYGETWELGEGYSLTVVSIDCANSPRTARLALGRNGVELDDVVLSQEKVYEYTFPGEKGVPKFFTYLDTVFAGDPFDVIQLRYIWFVSDNVTQIKEGDRLGVFNVTVVEPDRIELKNRVPIQLKAGSRINLLGNLSFFVENSDELRFYPTNVAGSQAIPGEVTENSVPETHDVATQAGKSPVADRTEEAAGFEIIISIAIILAAYIAGRKTK